MIDLHSHILPECDDGAQDLETALAMARIAVEQGTRIIACTPHVMPGLYDHDRPGIEMRVEAFRSALADAGIDLQLVVGGDVHIAPDLPEKLAAGLVPTLNRSRYLLLEPPHQVVPPNMVGLVERLMDAGFVPILTHPERLGWASSHYDIIEKINAAGALMQITAGASTGAFGRNAQRLADRMLEEGRVDIIASDAHNVSSRPPGLAIARDLVESRYGRELAEDLVMHKPARILENLPVDVAGSHVEASSPEPKGQDERSPLARLLEWFRHG